MAQLDEEGYVKRFVLGFVAGVVLGTSLWAIIIFALNDDDEFYETHNR